MILFLSSIVKQIKQNFVLILILIVAFFLYFPILGHKFVWDDFQFIVSDNNTKYLDKIPLLIRGYLPLSQGNSYRPLRSIFFALAYHFFKTQEINYHLFSIFVHLIVILLNYLVTLKITKRKTVSLLSAAIMAFHPINIEAITWASSSFNTIGNVFFYLSFYFYLTNLNKKNGSFFYSYIFAGLAFLTNEITYCLPLIILAYDFVFVKIKSFRLRLNKIYVKYFYILGTVAFIRSYFLADLNKIEFKPILNSSFFPILVGLKSLTLYLRLLILPFGQTVNHVIHKDITNFFFTDFVSKNIVWQNYFDFSLLIIPLALILLILFIKKLINRVPYLSFFLFVFFFSLLPVLNIIPSFTLFSERYLHIALFFFSLTFAYYINLIKKKYFGNSFIPFFTIFIYLFLLSFLTFRQNKVWHDEKSLWENVLKITPNSARANSNLGVDYFKDNHDMGINYLKKSVDLNPYYDEFRYKYAMSLIDSGEIEDAKNEFIYLIKTSKQKVLACEKTTNIFSSYKLFEDISFFSEYCR